MSQIKKVFLIFILLSLNEMGFAISFSSIQKKIQKNDICHINYNISKTAAIVNPDCGSAFYVDFKNKRTKKLVMDWPSAGSKWMSDTVVYVRGSCGTGCSQTVLFFAPSTKIICPTHEYRIESLNPDEPPDYYNNNPLLIDPNKKIYACYAKNNIIQIFRMPKKLLTFIYPPRGYYAEDAYIWHNHVVINYYDVYEKLKRIIYSNLIVRADQSSMQVSSSVKSASIKPHGR